MTSVIERPTVTVDVGRGEGGLAARRAVTRWAWRLFRREWRQQMLVLSLIVLAVAALVVGAAASTDSPPPANAGFGTAQYQANISGTPAHDLTQLSSLSHRYGTLDAIENDATPVPGSLLTFDFRSQNPDGPFGQPMLQLVSGRYPTLPGELAVTQGVAQDFNLRVGSVWHFEGKHWLVEGTVQNPQSLLDEFALVAPGQIPLTSSTKITALFDNNTGVAPTGSDIISAASAANTNANTGIISPATITLLLATVGMILIGLVAIAGFTVLAQRRLRSIGMLQSLGGTDRHVRIVVRANGAVVGVVGALLGAVLGFALWAAYRPHLESSSHHVIGLFQLPWTVLVIAVAIAMVTPFLAASRPARTITKVPVVQALSGRPAPPKPAHRSAIPGLVLLVASFALLGLAGASSNGGGVLPLLGGFVCLIAAIILLAPITVGLLGRLGHRMPVTARLALRDLARYRSRSASALAAISLGVLIAVVISVAASARYSDVLDYAGPNLSSNQLVVNADTPPPPGSQCLGPKGSCPSQNTQYPSMATQTSVADGIARSLGAAHDAVPLDTSTVGLQYGLNSGNGNLQFGGAIYVATPQLLRALGISQRQINPQADFLTMRAGLDSLGNMQMVWGNPGYPSSGPQNGPPGANGSAVPCPAGSCLNDPVIQYLPQLPQGTSAPNTLVTEHALAQTKQSGQASIFGWLISSAGPLTAAQISEARATASTAQLTIETKNDEPSSWQVVDWATAAGIALALAILAMTVGLIRAETASDLRTLAATGASSWSRRSITATTAGGLAFLGMLLGAAGGYLACAGYFQGGRFGESVFGNLSHVPLPNLLIIVVGLPVVAAVGGFIFSGRQPSLVSRQPIE